MENINRKHFRCYRKLQLWRVFHIVLAEDWMRLLPIQTFQSVKRRNVSESMYLPLNGMKSIKNRYYCRLCFHWPGSQQIHLPFKTAELHSSGNRECSEWHVLVTVDSLLSPSEHCTARGAVSGTQVSAGRASSLLPRILLSEMEDGLSSVPHIRKGSWCFRTALMGRVGCRAAWDSRSPPA